jgi:transcription initiation factor TFIID TATA-box-binding protein
MADKTKLKIQNIVATTSLNTKVPLVKLVRSQSNTEYNPEQFPGLVLRIKKPKSAVLVFNSGNLVCTGTKSIAQVKEVIVQVIRQLRKIGVKVKGKPRITVQNIVASGAGKLVCTGTKNRKQLDEAMKQLLKNIRPLVIRRRKK